LKYETQADGLLSLVTQKMALQQHPATAQAVKCHRANRSPGFESRIEVQ
jgi:hypothetical protein